MRQRRSCAVYGGRPVLTEANLDEVVARAAHRTDDETRQLVASLQPRQAPKEGIRKLPEPAARLPALAPVAVSAAVERDEAPPAAPKAPPDPAPAPEPFALASPPRPPSRATLEPVFRPLVAARHHRRRPQGWRLEFDHVEAAARGGPSTVEGLRLRCRAHDVLHAEETFGRAHMARFRKERSRGGAAIAGESAR